MAKGWRWLARSIVDSGAVYFSSQVVPGIHVQGWFSTLAAVLLLGLATCAIQPGLSSIGQLRRSPRWLTALMAGTLLWLAISLLAGVAGLAFQVDTVPAALVAAAVTQATSSLLVRLGGI